MRYRVDLDLTAEQVMAALPTEAARWEVTELIETAWAKPETWPPADGQELGEAFGSRCWIVFVAYRDGIEIFDVGWMS
ncbi:hypothetical protein AR457_10050 [Streptomyces agglomeratus]|uniref:hypothetical protein n=1 Tax=Streptomyces agglomeratus TaxID=285458 RepID=UPI000853F366|nr:hypothetical protein [Streptomyces agglomeratus]OEJ41229.1 hypothetical protein BGK70_26605 [Streptomyces agglomeratus]OEJ44393.1 hypothetical protein AR457_10050 [Streptomyces agglomeratus]